VGVGFAGVSGAGRRVGVTIVDKRCTDLEMQLPRVTTSDCSRKTNMKVMAITIVNVTQENPDVVSLKILHPHEFDFLAPAALAFCAIAPNDRPND
jgi:hypothetical protein